MDTSAALRLRSLGCALCLAAALVHPLAAAVTVPGQPVDGPGMSPRVTWDPESVYGGVARPPSVRPMSATEAALARSRAEAFFKALQGVPGFARPPRHATFVQSWAHLAAGARGPVLVQDLNVFWSAPRDTRQRADGAYFGAMGGAHEILYVDFNRLPTAEKLAEPEFNAYWRGVNGASDPRGMFPEPRAHGQAGGGTVYSGYWVATRDGRPALTPAPLGALLDGDIAALQQRVAQGERTRAALLAELEASMTPEAIAARRAKREASWAKTYRNPETMARELDAAARNDRSDHETRKARLEAADGPTGARAALAALQAKLQAAGEAGRSAPACGAPDPDFPPDLAMRWHAVGPDAPAGCKPMVRLREDLLGPGKPDEVRLAVAWLRDTHCGRGWDLPPADTLCSRITTTLRALDWQAVRASLGWPAQP